MSSWIFIISADGDSTTSLIQCITNKYSWNRDIDSEISKDTGMAFHATKIPHEGLTQLENSLLEVRIRKVVNEEALSYFTSYQGSRD